ncbi:MAG: DMT family transporter, partial [Casimicrobium sp.]
SLSSSSLLSRVAVPAFIFIWASGYVVAKLAATDAEALSFLVYRYAGVIALMLVLALVARAKWPSTRDAIHIAIAGVLIQAVYLGGVWVSIRMGLSAGLAALIVNLQPILTACLFFVTHERISVRQIVGIVVGFLGVVIVLASKLAAAQFALIPVLLCVLALVANTVGVIYQKRLVPQFDLRSGQVIQFTASLVATLPFAFAFESFNVRWTSDVIIAWLWSVFVLSGIGISLMFYLLRTGSITKLTSTMYIVPALTALMAWLMFKERLTINVLLGMIVTLVGIYLVVNTTKKHD